MFTKSDLRYALRTLARTPGFTLAVVVSLALGIGANTAIFSIVNGLLFHPPGVVEPEGLVAPRVSYKKLNLDRIVMSATDFADVRNSKEVFTSAAMANLDALNYTGGDSPQRLQDAQVTWQWFETFGVKPIFGRGFQAEEDQPGANNVAVLSFTTWQRLFGGDPSIIGRSVELNKKPYRVIGVMPADFRWPTQADLWTPIGLPPAAYAAQNRFNENYLVVARLQPNISFERAARYLPILTKRVIEHDPLGSFAKDSQWSLVVEPFTELISGNLKTPVLILLGAVGFVLLIVCSNVAGLMLVRGTARARELAIRTALGASRADLVRYAVIESLLLSAAGTALGLAAATTALKTFLSFAPTGIASQISVHVDAYVLMFTIALGVFAALLFGLMPAWQISRLGAHYEQLKAGGRSETETGHRMRLRETLVAAEVALALVLLVGAGLFLKSLARIRTVDPGFETKGVLTASIALPPAQYASEDKQGAFFQAVINRLAQTPGITSVGAVNSVPFDGGDPMGSFGIEGRVQFPGDPGPHGEFRVATPGYFDALKIPLKRGRFFTDADRKDAQPVAIIDEALAQQYWPNQDPIGKRMRFGSKSPWATIVGIVGHVKYSGLTGDNGKGTDYYPLYQVRNSSVYLTLRGNMGRAQLASALHNAVREVDPNQAIFDLKTMDERITAALGPQQFAVTLLGTFAGAALLLAMIGLYGIISYSVTRRTREIGIRAAIGAGRGRILAMVVVQGMRLVIAGLIVGALAAVGLARLASTQLFHVSAFDPGTFVVTAALLLASALAAALIPAWRATRVDPVTALRIE